MEGQRGAGSQEGSTALGDLHNIKIVYNAEIRDLDCFKSLLLCLGSCGFMKYNTKRGYLYVRENSIEMNYALTWCQDGPCGLESTTDYIKVWYFDAPPLKKESKCFGCMPMVRHTLKCSLSQTFLNIISIHSLSSSFHGRSLSWK